MLKIIFSVLSFISLALSMAAPAYAVTTPTFPSCANPQGEVKVSYSEGTHGIVGSTATYTGRDTVYTLSDNSLTQCFCDKDGLGIQTNWWKASSLTESEIEILKADGWYYLPTGNLWGLAQDPYLAKNYNYSCLPSGSNTPSSNSSSVQGDNGIGGGEEGEVLGLAATGNSLTLILVFSLGLAFILLGAKHVKKS